MNKAITIKTAKVENNRLNLITNEQINGLSPRDHILVDSDHFSFIYLMEKQDEYTYLVLPESIWPALKESINKKLSTFLLSDHEQLELTKFQEELEYVIDNIKGNGNYGEEMVDKIEKTF